MKRKTIKLWTGLGAYLLASTSAAALTANTGESVSPGPDASSSETLQIVAADARQGGEGGEKAQGGEGGEGGERSQGGEGGEKAQGGEGGEGGERGVYGGLPGDVELAARLLAMKGHLRAASDLLAAGHLENAAMHCAHPLSEEHEDTAPLLRERGIAPVEAALQALAERASGKDRAAIRTALDRAQAELDRALAATLSKSGADDTLPDALVALLRKAAHEYAESVKDGKIADKEEYQDARGFILVARAAVTDAGNALRKHGAEPYRELNAHLEKLASILDTPVPPAAAKAPASEVYATVARAEFALTNLR